MVKLKLLNTRNLNETYISLRLKRRKFEILLLMTDIRQLRKYIRHYVLATRVASQRHKYHFICN